MSYENRIRGERANMSKGFGRLADFLLDSYVEAAFMTASELAHVLDLDAATVVRFSQYLGYSGFPKLQQEIQERVKTDLLIRPHQVKKADSTPGIMQEAFNESILALEQTRNSMDINALEILVEKLGEAERIIILAEGPAQSTSFNLVNYLEQGSFPVFHTKPGIADIARAVNSATTNDIIISIEISSQSPYLARAMKEAQQKDIQTVAIVGASSLPTARHADIILAAQAQPSPGIGIVSVEAIVYVIYQVLRLNYPEAYSGSDEAIATLTEEIQHPS